MPEPGRAHFLFAPLLLLLAPLSPVRAQESAREEQAYDIPAQPLGDALAMAATHARIGIAFEPGVVAGRRSSAVRGRFTPQLLLREILVGTGLAARFTSQASAIVYDPRSPAAASTAQARRRRSDRPALDLDLAVVRAPRMIGRRDPTATNDYIRRAESEIQAMFARARAYRGKAFRLRIAVAIDAEGRIGHVALERPSGNREHDGRIEETILGQMIGPPPPPNLVQPLRFDIAGTEMGAAQRRAP